MQSPRPRPPRHRALVPRAAVTASAAVAASLAIATGVLASRSIGAALETSRWVNRAHRMGDALAATYMAVTGAETAQRGYLLTGDPAFLAGRASHAEAHRRLAEARRLASPEPAQRARLDSLAAAVEARLALLETTVRLATAGRPDSAIAIVRSGAGVTAMERVRQLVARTMDVETRLLAVRIAARDAQLDDARRAILVSLGAAVLAAALALAILRREARRLAQARSVAEDAERRAIASEEEAWAAEGRARAARVALEAQVMHDELTGLLNRRGFRALAEQELKVARRSGRVDAVLYLDVDGFKAVNDAHGHAAGDEALRTVAGVLRNALREGDVVARLGGDEFAVYAPGLGAGGEGSALAARLGAALAAHSAAAQAAGRPYRLEASIGAAEPQPGEDLDAVIARADAALYVQKETRRRAA